MNRYNEEDDPIFSADAVLGTIMSILSTIGVFCAFVAACFFWGWLS
jgi:hypothetical protein